MKKFLLFQSTLFLLVTASVVSCKKTDNTINGSNNNYSAPLFSESSGWKQIAIVNSSQTLGSANWMTPLDLNIVNNNAQVVYYTDNNYKLISYLKASYGLSGGTDTKITPLDKLYSVQDNFNLSHDISFGNVFFHPETYNIESLSYPYYQGQVVFIKLHDEVGKELTSQISSNFADLGETTKMYPNGDILAGGIYSTSVIEFSYYTRATNTWNRIGETALDTSYNIAYTPFKIDDGSLLAFRLFSKNKTKQAFLSISDFIKTPTAPYKARFVEEHLEYAPTNIIYNQFSPDVIEFASEVKIVNYATEGNSFTVVLKEQNNKTKAYTLSAYKWTKGNTGFQKLYTNIPISKILGDNLNRRDLVLCAINGTVSVIVKEGISGNDLTYSLATCNAEGEKRLGAAKNNTYNRAVPTLSCLRFINGSYYAVASPFLFSDANAEGQHMDIVKLTQ